MEILEAAVAADREMASVVVSGAKLSTTQHLILKATASAADPYE